jgi:hypothetical protein
MSHRPRQYFYVPPANWQAVPSGLVANWYPLDFPNNLATIVVFPASFVTGEPSIVVEDTLAGAGAGLEVEASARDEVTSASGVKGAHVRLTGRRAGRAEPIHRDMMIYVVAPYAYRMRLETTNSARLIELREIFHGVAGSFRPLPTSEESRVGRAFAARSVAFDHWAS